MIGCRDFEDLPRLGRSIRVLWAINFRHRLWHWPGLQFFLEGPTTLPTVGSLYAAILVPLIKRLRDAPATYF